MSNDRIYYAIQQVGLRADGEAGAFDDDDVLYGVQSVGMSANFPLEEVFQLGHLQPYEYAEMGLPELEVTMQKALDGYPLLYHQATKGDTTVAPTLAGRGKTKTLFGMSIFSDEQEAAEGEPTSLLSASGMYVNSSSFTFSRDGFFTEDITLVGNNRIWASLPDGANPALPTPVFSGQFDASEDLSPVGQGGVNRRENFLWEHEGTGLDINGMCNDPNATILPPEVAGISSTGTNDLDEDGQYGAHINSISVNVDFNREQIDELGRKGPYCRYIGFPVEVTCEIEATSTSGDLISFTEEGIYTTGEGCGADKGNLLNRTIRIATCEGTRIYLGPKNKLQTVSQDGGDAGDGGNVNVTYSFSNWNFYTVLHSGDPHDSGATWWTNSADYLVHETS